MNNWLATKPTGNQCNENALIPAPEGSPEGLVFRAGWYPQMGGYAARCVVVAPLGVDDDGDTGCFEVYVWHDGEWPFHNGEQPRHLHHCDAQQFIEFGQWVDAAMRSTS